MSFFAPPPHDFLWGVGDVGDIYGHLKLLTVRKVIIAVPGITHISAEMVLCFRTKLCRLLPTG